MIEPVDPFQCRVFDADPQRIAEMLASGGAGDELADVLMSRYEKASAIITSNRPFEDWAKLLGDAVVVTPLLDRLMHHGHLLKFEGKSWRLKEAAARIAKRSSSTKAPSVPPQGVEKFDPATGGGV